MLKRIWKLLIGKAPTPKEQFEHTSDLRQTALSSKEVQSRSAAAKRDTPSVLRSNAVDPAPANEKPRNIDGHPAAKILKGKTFVIDGDTIVISGTHIRIAGIDAPELDHPWGRKSKSAMINLCKGKVVTAVLQPATSYDRMVAKCYLDDGTDLAAELVKQGMAIDWPKYSGGAYRHLEPEGIRKKHWRAAARQRGRYKPGT
ncbi:thermonuclease family protein [Jannaschia sp. 2305UL9-9]|uniref:thermonuclease family protein n=1 Tax=Jannaschia sp. 2305UL9-9 TaxID=3121638 RepID=UPI00352763C4